MDFFGIGMGELLLIIVVILIVWGPQRLPEIAQTLGKTIRALRKTTSDLTADVTKEIDNIENDPPSQPKQNSSRRPENDRK